MITNQNMTRLMGEFKVVQRTKDGMFNATDLADQWNTHDPDNVKRIDNFLVNSATKNFIKALNEEVVLQNYTSKLQISYETLQRELDLFDIQNIPKEILDSTRGRYGGTWMHPFLFIKFAMWLNPRFEVQVIKFVYDKLISYRHGAGDNYKTLSGAASRFDDVNYKRVAKGLNYIIFGKHQNGIRNYATEKELERLVKLEEKLAFCIDMGYIKSFDDLIGEMRRIYYDTHDKKIYRQSR